jgi:cellulose synthase/poly-beta-1,6-N-acetylglucosamine synthase-like glycosyltransferase
MQVQLPSELLIALNYIAIGLLSIFYGFFATGRDGLMYDLRIVRGLHRVRWNVTFYAFTVYSILLSLSQWSISSDCSENVHINNHTNVLTISNGCSNTVSASMWLWVVILILDALYIITLLSHRDYRSERLIKERIKIRRIQKSQMVFSLCILCVRIILLVIRFGFMVAAVPLSAATFLNVTIIVFLGCNLYAHARSISIYSYHINDLETKNITDTSEVKTKSSSQRLLLESSDEEGESSDDVAMDKKPLMTKSTSSKRPVIKIKQ